MIHPSERTFWFALKKFQGGVIPHPFFVLSRLPQRLSLRKKIAQGKIRSIIVPALKQGFGDVIIYHYALRALKVAHPDIRITLILLNDQFVALAKRFGICDRFLTAHEHTVTELASEHYDAIVDFTVEGNGFVTGIMKAFPSLHRLSFLNTKQGVISERTISFRRDRLIALQYCTLLSPFAVAADPKPLQLDILPNEQEKVSTFLSRAAGRTLIGIVAGGKTSTMGTQRRWPLDRYTVLMKRIASAHKDIAFVLLGAPDESKDIAPLENAVDTQILNACGQFSFIENAHLISRLSMLVSNDTAPVHVAAILGVPALSFHMNGLDPWYPMSMPSRPHRIIEFDVAAEISVDTAFTVFTALAADIGLARS